MQAMMQAARGRKLTDWQEPTDAEELAILEQFPADERDAIAQMDPEELVQFAKLGTRRARSRKKHAESCGLRSRTARFGRAFMTDERLN